MEQSAGHITKEQRSHIWLIALVILCLAIFAYGYFYNKPSTDDLAFLFGYNFAIGLVIWAVFCVALGRKHGKKHAAISFLAIFGSLIASGLIGYSQHKTAMIKAATEIQKEYSSLLGSTTDSQGLPKRIESKINTTKGAMGEMERFIKTFMNQMASERNDYLLELEAIGWEKILDPERVKADKRLIQSKTMIQNAKDIVAKYRHRTSTLLNKARKDISNLDLTESLKQEIRNGFDRGMAKSSSQIDAMWDYEAQIVCEFENIFTLLSERRGKWGVQDGQILFVNETDLKAFNLHLVSIQELLRKQEAIQKQSIEAFDRNMNKLKN